MSKHPVVMQLARGGCLDCCDRYEEVGATVRGVVRLDLIAQLQADRRFACGPFHLMHADVGEPRTEFRSHTGELGDGSLQIVINTQTGDFYADVDKFSPYSDLVGVVGHFFGEVMGPWFRRKRKS